MTRIPRYSTLSHYQLEQIKIIDRTCRDVTFKTSYATMPHDPLPRSHPLERQSIHLPRLRLAGVRSRSIAFQGTHPSRGHTLDSSSVSLTEPLYASSRPPSTATLTFSLECRRQTRSEKRGMIRLKRSGREFRL